MTELSVADEPHIEVSSLEIDRDGASFTIDTLAELDRPGRELFLILGEDAYAGLDTWHCADAIGQAATIATVVRPGAVRSDSRSDRVLAVVMDEVDVSSTSIRERVRHGDSIDGLVHSDVAAYISDRGLYA